MLLLLTGPFVLTNGRSPAPDTLRCRCYVMTSASQDRWLTVLLWVLAVLVLVGGIWATGRIGSMEP